MFQVEFLGGPYDGHQQTCSHKIRLPTQVIWPVCADAFALLNGTIRCRTGTITSIALYEIAWESGAVRYRFMRAFAFKDIENSLRGLAEMPGKTR